MIDIFYMKYLWGWAGGMILGGKFAIRIDRPYTTLNFTFNDGEAS